MTGDRVLIDRDGHVAHVRLNRPEKRNAIDTAMMAELRKAAIGIAADPGVRAVVLSGEGHTFCSGLDTGAIMAMGAGEVSGDAVLRTAEGLSPEGATPPQQIAWLWHELPVPVVAAVEGHAVGGGLHIALAADMRVIAPDALVGFVEITWGLIPDLTGTQGLRRLVSLDVAKRLILSGELVSGTEAVELGLATFVDDDPVGRALELARTIAGHNPDAVRVAKRVLNQSALVSVAEGLANEVAGVASLVGSPNQMEAVIARLEGRPADFADPTG